MNKFHRIVHAAIYFCTPSFWRVLLTGRMKVHVYLSGGQTVTFKLTKYSVDLATKGAKSYNFSDMGLDLAFSPADVIGIKEVRWFW